MGFGLCSDNKDGLHARFYDACRAYDFDEMEALIAEGFEINETVTSENITVLFEAIKAKEPKLVRWMLDHGADPNFIKLPSASDPNRFGIFESACRFGTPEIALMILDAPNFKITPGDDKIVLNACALGSPDEQSVAAQVARMIDVETIGLDALIHSISHGKAEAAHILLDRGVKAGMQLNTLLLECARRPGMLPVFERLMDPGGSLAIARQRRLQDDFTNINPLFTSTLLHEAARGGYIEMLEYLHARGVPLGGYDVPPLIAALDRKQEAAVAWLLKHGANPDPSHPLHTGLKFGTETIPALCFAILQQDEASFNHLLAHGADIHRGEPGRKPLDFAAGMRDAQIFQTLCERGADLRPYLKSNAPLTAELREIVARHLALVGERLRMVATARGFSERSGVALIEKEFFHPATETEPERATRKLLQLAGAGKLSELFEPGYWKNNAPTNVAAFRNRLREALPSYYRSQVEAIDLCWTGSALPGPHVQTLAQREPSLAGKRR